MNPDPSLDIIKATVNELILNPEIILFGSRARGSENPGSDYDLLIIIEEPIDVSVRLHYQAILRKRLAEKDILSDVIVQSRNEMEVKKNLPGHIVQSAMMEGIHV